MNRLIFVAALSTILAGCAAGGGGYTHSAAYDGAGYAGNPYRSETGSPTDWSKPYYGDRYWPPVDLNSPFPPQIMDGRGRGK
ncbi:MAG: hypothetical protein ACT4PS_01440 [Betaproteobacteria bacterium]